MPRLSFPALFWTAFSVAFVGGCSSTEKTIDLEKSAAVVEHEESEARVESSPGVSPEPVVVPPSPAPAVRVKRKARVAPPLGNRKERLEAAADVDLGDAILFECIVRLPDDPTENRELCRSFQMTVAEAGGAGATRFRFGLDGIYRFTKATPGGKYRLQTSPGSNWSVSIDPDRDFVSGDRVLIELKQKSITPGN